MYPIPGAQKMSDLDISKIMLGLMSRSGEGKTFSGLTFPNPVVGDIDDNLQAHKHRTDVQRLNFNDPEWIYTWYKYNKNTIKFPIRDALLFWIRTEGLKLHSDQTFLLDSWTTLHDAFDQQIALEPVRSKDGSINDYAPWDAKIDYSRDVLLALKALKCHVVVTFHEQEQKDASGKLIGKIEPLMQGKFVKKLGIYFSDFFRCVSESVYADDKKTLKSTKYMWQTKSSSEVALKSRMVDCPMFIEPHFKSFKY